MSGFLTDALAKYRLLTGDTQHDALLRADASGYVRYRLTGDPAPLESALRRNAEAFRSNWEAYTSEMRWTDRVISFTRNLPELPGRTRPARAVAGNPLQQRDRRSGQSAGVSLERGALANAAARDRRARHRIQPHVVRRGVVSLRHPAARLGRRVIPVVARRIRTDVDISGAETGAPLQRRTFRVEGPRVRVSLQLPARRLCVVKVAKT